jgi:hypothetical protein
MEFEQFQMVKASHQTPFHYAAGHGSPHPQNAMNSGVVIPNSGGHQNYIMNPSMNAAHHGQMSSHGVKQHQPHHGMQQQHSHYQAKIDRNIGKIRNHNKQLFNDQQLLELYCNPEVNYRKKRQEKQRYDYKLKNTPKKISYGQTQINQNGVLIADPGYQSHPSQGVYNGPVGNVMYTDKPRTIGCVSHEKAPSRQYLDNPVANHSGTMQNNSITLDHNGHIINPLNKHRTKLQFENKVALSPGNGPREGSIGTDFQRRK